MRTIQSEEKIKEVNKYYQKMEEVSNEHYRHWLEHTLFHWDFWLSVFLSIAPVIFWIKIRNKRSTNRLLFVGMFVLIISSWLDYIGIQSGRWFYTGKMFPVFPAYVPWDIVILPVFVMILIQIKPQWSPLLKSMIFAGVCAFIGEPIMMWIGIYVIKDWSIVYSFPIYFMIYFTAHKLSKVEGFDPI